jgi:hypothetical protein
MHDAMAVLFTAPREAQLAEKILQASKRTSVVVGFGTVARRPQTDPAV